MKQIPITDQALSDHLEGLTTDCMDVFVLADGSVRGAAINATRLVNDMQRNHSLGILETLILGHAYIGALLMTSHLKGRDRLGLSLKSSGPIEGLSVESNVIGEVRGFLMNPKIELAEAPDSFDTAPFIGQGVLTVTRIAEGSVRPFSGSVEVTDGDLAHNLARYYLQSEQLPSGFSLSVQFSAEGKVVGAGGLMMQALPAADPETLAVIEAQLSAMESIGSRIAGGSTPMQIVHKDFADFAPTLIGSKEVRFTCHCSKAKFGNFVAALPADEVQSILDDKDFPMRTTCHYCNTTYEFSKPEVKLLRDRARLHETTQKE